jgi:hypothetical protein
MPYWTFEEEEIYGDVQNPGNDTLVNGTIVTSQPHKGPCEECGLNMHTV